jgi:hypothetical protein
MIRTLIPALALLVPLLLAGCTTTEEGSPDQVAPVRLERIDGQRGQHLGWIRTEAAGQDGTYEVIYDRDWHVIGYTTVDGRHYTPEGRRLDYLGAYGRRQGLGELFDQRAVDVSTQKVDRHQLASSGPLAPGSGTLTLTGDAGEDDADYEE